MTVPVVLSSSPSNGETEISIEVSPTITFNTSIDSDSVSMGTATLYRSDTWDPLYCTYVVSGATVEIKPETALMEDMSYRIVLSGDSDNPAGRIQSSDGDYLAADVTIAFRTGTERFVSIEEIESRTGIERAGPIRETDPLASQTTSGYLSVSSMSPEAYSYEVDITTTGIILTFSQELDSSQDVDSLVTITQSNVFGMDCMYASDTDGDGTIDFDPDTEEGTEPTGTLSISGNQVIWTVDSSSDFLYNTKVSVEVDSAISSVGGSTLEEDYSAYFLTDLFPMYIGVNLIRAQMGPVLDSIYSSTIAQIIHKNSIEIWEMSGRDFDVESPKFAHRQYVLCKTIIDIINVLTLASQMALGQTKTLGDFSLQQKPADPRYLYMLADAKECLERYGNLIWGSVLATTAVKGSLASSRRGATRYRTWDRFYLRRVPAVGITEDRQEIYDLDLDYSLGDKDATTLDRYI